MEYSAVEKPQGGRREKGVGASNLGHHAFSRRADAFRRLAKCAIASLIAIARETLLNEGRSGIDTLSRPQRPVGPLLENLKTPPPKSPPTSDREIRKTIH